MQRNLPLLASRDEIDIAEAARTIAGLRPNPELNIGMEQLPVYTNIRSFKMPNFYRTNGDGSADPVYTSEFSQLFERGGKRKLRTEQATAELDATKSRSLDVLRDQLLTLREAFTDALLAKENLALAQETDNQYAETERLMDIRLRGGEIAEVDLDRVKAARLPYLQAVMQAQLEYQQALRKIATSLGVADSAASTITEISGDLDIRSLVPAAEELRGMAIAERPDLDAARNEVRAATTGTKLAESLRKRDITGSFMAQRSGQDYAVGAMLSFQLFTFNNQRAAIAKAAAEQRLSNTRLHQAEVEVQNEVQQAYQALLTSQKALELYNQTAIERSRQIRSIINYSYQRGEADLLDVLDAQRSANEILTGYNQARANYMNAIWQLQHAVGRSF